ncbi:glycosyltransferase [Streptomyces sp. NBRC 109706]|uniref:glycosyltransferase n=1 Tax=Streptomyces sp. NBRC 109706 TaxID=1550035 RepID=UPI0007825062|nr:glycosyltransferase [Streptomyces sp. NBRC 109706]
MSAANRPAPSVGVVVPLYRVERFVADTVAALAAQTVRPDRVVLVDDRGGDRSVAVALDAARAHGLPVTLITHPRNRGLSAARNTGLDALDTDLVWFCDSDDTADPRFVELLRAAIVEHDAALAVARTALVTREGRRTGVVEPSSPEPACPGEEYARRILVNEARGYACNKLVRRDLLDGVRFPEGMAYEDLPVLLRLALRTRTVALVDEPLYHYTTNEASLSRRFGPHTLDLFAQEALVRAELTRAGLLGDDRAGRWRSTYTRYRYDGVLLPVANMALRSLAAARGSADGVPDGLRQDVGAAVRLARRSVRARELAALWRAGARRAAVAGAVLALTPRGYAAVLERR